VDKSVYTHEYFMEAAYKQAILAYEDGEVPVGAVVVANDKIIARGYNQTERLNDVTAHAEMLALTAASNVLGAKYLINCTLYVTLEPCVMCAGALFWSQINKVVYGASDEKRGFNRLGTKILHPKTELIAGVMEGKCRALIEGFFRELRG
jgi:tRNA(adenine34) deaminase